MTRRFDRIIAVDGSASATPKRGPDSIWMVLAEADVDEPVNPSTRSAAFDLLGEWCDRPGRTLVVVDWSLGYPAGTARAVGLGDDRPAWEAMWAFLGERVVDTDDNRNNRFEVADELNRRTPAAGPFWGAPARSATEWLPVRKQPFVDVVEWRLAEQRLRAERRRPSSCWQLGGAGAVGSQSLVGIARLARLRIDLSARRRVAVWPFETGLCPPDDEVDVVIAEMWPTLVADAATLPAHWIRDAAQVDAVVRRCREAEASGELDDWFRPPVESASSVVGEEGWILGLR